MKIKTILILFLANFAVGTKSNNLRDRAGSLFDRIRNFLRTRFLGWPSVVSSTELSFAVEGAELNSLTD
jgi:hypothetical protein